jgi:hypothetical protein
MCNGAARPAQAPWERETSAELGWAGHPVMPSGPGCQATLCLFSVWPARFHLRWQQRPDGTENSGAGRGGATAPQHLQRQVGWWVACWPGVARGPGRPRLGHWGARGHAAERLPFLVSRFGSGGAGSGWGKKHSESFTSPRRMKALTAPLLQYLPVCDSEDSGARHPKVR